MKAIEIILDSKALVLDFDGTLVDSNTIKLSAFEKCFAGYSDHFAEIMAYCKTKHHIPRQEKFRFVYENILKIPYTPELEKHLLETYASETTQQVITAREIPGATQFLEKFHVGKMMALLSSTPHETLCNILEKRGLKKYFKTIQGAPVNKAAWLRQFMNEGGYQKEELVFIGDSEEDYLSAKQAGVPFIGVNSSSLKEEPFYLENFELLPL